MNLTPSQGFDGMYDTHLDMIDIPISPIICRLFTSHESPGFVNCEDETLGSHHFVQGFARHWETGRCSKWLKSENVGNGMNQR